MKEKIKKSLKNSKILYSFFKFIWDIYYYVILLKLFALIFRVFKIKNNKIVVCSYYGKGYGDNPKAIVNKLLELSDELDIVWALDSNNYNSSLPDKIRRVKYESISYLYELVTAKIWIDNSRKKFLPLKRKNQFYIQTWHSGIGLKNSEKGAINELPKEYIKMAKKDSKNADLFISNSKWETDIYKDIFWYNGEILEVGIPRNDILIHRNSNDDLINKVRKTLNISSDVRLVLYAPTFRKDENIDVYNIDVDKVLNTLKNLTEDDWKFLVRLHPNVNKCAKNLKLKNYIDVSNYPDLHELMIASDVLISDYSSLMFDFSYQQKPVFLYTPDINLYNEDRGFLFDLYKLPFDICEDNQKLITKIKEFDLKKYKDRLNDFYENLGLNETGKSAEYIAKRIIKEMK